MQVQRKRVQLIVLSRAHPLSAHHVNFQPPSPVEMTECKQHGWHIEFSSMNQNLKDNDLKDHKNISLEQQTHQEALFGYTSWN